MTLLKVGKSIDGWCTRCKLVLTHTIEAVAGGKITRVHCNTCGGQHAHRARAPGARAVAGTRARPASAGRSEEPKTRRSEYETLLRGRTAAAARPYSMAARFKVNDLISHATFGLGAVTAERDNIKIEVLFADGARVLVHGR
jgi:hypothetical protein